MTRYYADTYALVEILRGSPAYERYAGEKLVTSEFNLLELAYALTRDYDKERAVEILKIVRAFIAIIQPTDKDYAEASSLHIELKKQDRNLSLIDTLGYVLVKRLKILFLTGDREFKDLDGVEYVK
ncbi:MAG: type II toxin-antitoxin system VapC family toxin [Thaumarchaeota archaeon]|nr:MAG: type II toxin-antitoxin system VapC family toxin [Nitrososphaerota archaeon]